MGSALLLLMASAVGIVGVAAIACRPCYGSHYIDTAKKDSQLTAPVPVHLFCKQDDEAKKIQSDQAKVGIRGVVCPVGDQLAFKIQDVVELKDESSSASQDALFFTACLIHALDMAEHGFHPYFANCSGIPCTCVSITEWVAHVKNATGAPDHERGLFTKFTPHGLRWATVVTCVIAVLAAWLP
ncbi:envelope glycoprotein 4 [Arteriviridae sp.]|nr:envelope glycoprotein 4 [Arteriviridae sp.]